MDIKILAKIEGNDEIDHSFMGVTRTAPKYTRLYHVLLRLTNQIPLNFSEVKIKITLLKPIGFLLY